MATTDFNPIFRTAAGFVQHTNKHVYLTGKAGTGKTTFLRYLKENTMKNIAVVAPTGVAAINAGGVTMHSFFQLPFGIFLPTKSYSYSEASVEISTEHTLIQNLRFNRSKRELFKELELLVIDEVSMVRADMLDAIDVILRHYRQNPHEAFGGVQMLFIGDLFQLPPVANRQEWQILSEYYSSPYFFDARVIKESPPIYLELKKIYRQSDNNFIHILNNIRNNQATNEDLEELHQHFKPGFAPYKEDNYITLTSHNAKADAINQRELQNLPGRTFAFDGTVKGEFSEKAFPADKTLYLKEGAQIMFLKNDKGENRRFYNGKIGLIRRIEEDKIFVTFPNEEGELELEKETWNNIRYSYNRDEDKIDEEELGSFTQYPIRLAWAITIHKSQGLTFEKAIIDAGEAFAPGQVYVALSRLTSMDGLVLYSKIVPQSIKTDERILEFAKTELKEDELQELLQEEQKVYISQSLLSTFNLHKLIDLFEAHYESYEQRQIPDQRAAEEWAAEQLQKMKKHQQVALRFIQQLEGLLVTAEQDQFTTLYERIQAAADYFVKVLDEMMLAIKLHSEQWKPKSKAKKYNKDLDGLRLVVDRKKFHIQHAVHLAKGLTQGLDAVSLLQIVEEQRKKIQASAAAITAVTDKEKVAKGQTRALSLELYKKGKTVQEIAAERNLTVSTIEGHLASYIETGEIDIKEIVPEEKIPAILKAIDESEPKSLGTIKYKLGNDFSYGEIKAVLTYQQVAQGT